MAQFAKEVAEALENIGLTKIILPFALTFVILFAVLQKTMIFGKDKENKPKRKLNAALALIVSFLVVAYADTVAVVSKIAQYGVVLLVAGLVAVIIFAFTGFPKMGQHKLFKIIGALVFIVFLFYVLGGFELIEKGQIETKILVPVIAIAAFIFVVYLIIKPKKEKITEKEKGKKTFPGMEETRSGAPREGFGP